MRSSLLHRVGTGWRLAVGAAAWMLMSAGEARGQAAESADAWLPGGAPPGMFDGLSAEISAAEGRLAVAWVPAGLVPAGGRVLLEASTGRPGHWSSRDWREWPMTGGAGGWRGLVPLASGLEPLVYRVRSEVDGVTNASPLRVFRPSLAGAAVPVFPFGGFLEGFEGDLSGWSPTVPGVAGGMGWSTHALTGRRALRIEVPEGRGSMTVGTVRLRGWMLTEHSPVAVRFAARTEGGEGRVGCGLHGHAGTDRLEVYPAKGEFTIGSEWRRLEVPLEAFVGLQAAEVDWMTIQFRAETGRSLLVDDVELVLR